MDGILNNGFDHAISFMFNYAYKVQLQFEQATKSGKRDFKFLVDGLENPDTINLIDTKMHILGYTYDIMKDICMNSALQFFQTYRDRFIIIYVVFLVLLVVSVGYFFIIAFKKLKMIMWNTNIILKTIPKAAISKKDNEKLKQFFIS